MKRRLYPVVKHTARFTLACVSVLVLAIATWSVEFNHDPLAVLQQFLYLCSQGSSAATEHELAIVIFDVLITLTMGLRPVFGSIRLRAAKTLAILLIDDGDVIAAGPMGL